MKLIDTQVFKQLGLCRKVDCNKCPFAFHGIMCKFKTILELAPAVEIIRCRDCENFDPEHEGGIGSCALDMNVTADDFCSQAIRNGEAEE